MKRRKVLDDERRSRQVQAGIDSKATRARVERNYDSEDEKEDEALPRYEDVIDNREGSSSNGTGSNSGVQHGNESPPDYGRHVEPRRHAKVDFQPRTS